MNDSGVNISPNDPHLELDKTIQLAGDIKVTQRSIDDLSDEQREKLLGIKPTSAVRVIPSTSWFKIF